MSDIDEWVEWYGAQGLVYFPLFGIMNGACRCKDGASCGNPGKHPMFRWKDRPPVKPSELDNVGISTDNLVVIDLDDPSSSPSDYPDTFTTSTGKGFHLWYRARDDVKQIKSLVGWRRKVDIRAHGGLVVAPPSRHISGASYRAVNDLPINLITDDLLYVLPEKSSNYHRTGVTVEVTLDETPTMMYPMVRRLVEDMLGYANSESGSRNVTLFKVACRYYQMASKSQLGKDAEDEIVAAALHTGLTGEEIGRTLASARRAQ